LKLTAGGSADGIPAPVFGTRVHASIIHVPLRRFPSLVEG